MAVRFRNAFYGIARWLVKGDGELVHYSLGLVMDAMAERFRLSYEADLPEYCPSDALPYLGRDRAIRRGRGESDAAYGARLVRYLDDHLTQGNPYALMDQLYAYLQTSGVTLRTVDRRGNWYERAADGSRSVTLDQGNWDWDGGASTSWSRFWVIIFVDQGPWTLRWTHTAGGSGTATDGTTSATAAEVAAVKSIIAEWKPAGTRCEWIIVCEDDPSTKFGPTTGDDPGGTWGDWSDGAASARPVRDSSARYWVGPRE